MSISTIFVQLVSTVLLFPGNLLLIGAIGLLLRSYWRRAVWLSWAALMLLCLFSTRWGSLLLTTPLERQTPVLTRMPTSAQAIVVLGGGRLSNAPEYGHLDMPNTRTLARLRYAARLQRASGLPILVSGGKPDASLESEAEVMARSLHQDFGVKVRWLEKASGNTAENAHLTASLLRQHNVQRIVLVTDALHMPRALAIFHKTGLDVVAAPTIFFSHARRTLPDYLPGGEGLRRSNDALHEWLGRLWYAIRDA